MALTPKELAALKRATTFHPAKWGYRRGKKTYL